MRCLSLMALSSMDSDGRRNPSLHVSILFREFLGLYSFCSAKWESSRSACHREVDLEKAEIPENLAYNHKSQKSKITFPYKLIIFPYSVIRLVSRPIKAHSFFFMLLLIGPPNQADPAGLWLLRTKWYRRWLSTLILRKDLESDTYCCKCNGARFSTIGEIQTYSRSEPIRNELGRRCLYRISVLASCLSTLVMRGKDYIIVFYSILSYCIFLWVCLSDATWPPLVPRNSRPA